MRPINKIRLSQRPIPPLISLGLALALTACGSIGKVKNEAKLAKVKKLVIFGVTIQQEQQADNLNLGALVSGGDKEKSHSDQPEIQKMARGVYGELSRSLSKTTGKKVLPIQALLKNSSYRSIYQSKMGPGKMIKSMYTSGQSRPVFVPGVLSLYEFRALSQKQKVDIAKSLGADGFVEYLAVQNIKQGWGIGNLTGSGDFSYVTRSNIRVFDLHSEDPIFQIQNVDGEKSRDSEGIAGSKFKKMSVLGLESTKSSIDKAVKEYQ